MASAHSRAEKGVKGVFVFCQHIIVVKKAVKAIREKGLILIVVEELEESLSGSTHRAPTLISSEAKECLKHE